MWIYLAILVINGLLWYSYEKSRYKNIPIKRISNYKQKDFERTLLLCENVTKYKIIK